MFNADDANEMLQDVEFVCYGVGTEFGTKQDMIKALNIYNTVKVPYKFAKLKDVKEDDLKNWFADWNSEFEIDGLIIELNDVNLRAKLGRERNNNPAYARAWKGFDAMQATTTINGVSFKVSKEGKLAPVGQVQPVDLDGVTVSNVTLNNAGMMEAEGWWKGSEVTIIRSGMVIPKIIETTQQVKPALPTTCPSCNSDLEWDENHVHLLCTNTWACEAQRLQQIVSFLKIIGVDNVGEGVVEQLYDAGYTSVRKVVKARKEDLESLDGFGRRKADIVHTNIHAKLKDVPLEKLQHAMGCFKGLGSKKLVLLNEYNTKDNKPTQTQVESVEGFSETSAKAYLKGFDLFWDYIKTIPEITIAQPKQASGDKCKDMVFCFTGFRSKALEEAIEDELGKVGSSVSKKTTHVVTSDRDGSTSKLNKARDLGLTIWEPNELENFLDLDSKPSPKTTPKPVMVGGNTDVDLGDDDEEHPW
jgi:DNA ligase (NAD+)